MEKKTMGSFMAALRKANGLTQQQIADKLNVSNKTVSKWECDEGYPEITMLPAIAEIYSVTVDELLRGEKIAKENHDAPKNDGKAKKLMMHLFKSSENKYFTLSVISLVLSCFALFISLFFVSETLGVIISLLLVGAAVITEIIAFMNYRRLLEDPEAAIPDDLKLNSKKKIRNFIISIFAVSSVTLAQVIIALTYGYFIPWLALAVFVVMIACMLLYRFIGEKFLIEENLSEEYVSYRQKIVRTISKISLIVFAIGIVLPFVIVFFQGKFEETKFSFGLDSYDESSEINYYKLKNHILNGIELYYYDLSNADETGIDICKIDIKTSEHKGRLIIVELYEDEWEYKEFSNKKERDEFIEKYVINSSVYDFLYFSYRNCESISFDDESLTLITKKTETNWLSAFDILPAFILISVITSSVSIVTGFILCYRKK